MRLHRFIVPVDLHASSITITDPALLNQWTKVLRLCAGDRVILCDGKGMQAEATIVGMGRSSITCTPDAPSPVAAEPKKDVTLYCAVLKRENFEWVVQKCTELGIKAIIPIVTTRTVKTGLKMDRLRTIAKEAAEQSGRGVIPIIDHPIEFDRALEEAKKMTNIFYDCPHHPSTQPSSHPAIQQSTSRTMDQLHTPVAIWIGPEGGWTEEETAKAKNAGFAIASLGQGTLRAETAAAVASYLAIADGRYAARGAPTRTSLP